MKLNLRLQSSMLTAAALLGLGAIASAPANAAVTSLASLASKRGQPPACIPKLRSAGTQWQIAGGAEARRVARPATSMAGLRVGIDPETGRLGPPSTQQTLELEALSPRLESADDPLIFVLADGSKMAILGDRFMQYSVARIDASGKLRGGCVHGPQGLAHFLGCDHLPRTASAPNPAAPARFVEE